MSKVTNRRISARALKLQNTCHASIDEFLKNDSMTTAEAMNIWLFTELAEMQLRIELLAKELKSTNAELAETKESLSMRIESRAKRPVVYR